ncbi:hypothetical protein DV872_06000 [Oceanispirochaeta sp. M1]|nr:hypothetical protein DV872_06000 [Oceanispirochaeta sp. M1]
MLTSKGLLYLIELKDARQKWRNHALDQLESTINLIHENHPDILQTYEIKKAYVCNKKKRNGPETSQEIQKKIAK